MSSIAATATSYDDHEATALSVIEDTGKVLQGFIAPEVRAISARLDALEERFDGLGKQVEAVEKRVGKHHEEVMSAIRQVIDFNSIQQRLTKL